jgi:hypothetical protein
MNMTKEELTKAIKALKNISIDFRMDYFMNQTDCIVRGIFLDNPDDVSKVKSILDGNILKGFKFKKSKGWYLGDEKEAIYMQLKDKMLLSVREIEDFQVSNYA